ncbi:AT-hook motif nuclear-localized protein 10-like [Typha angustifolia]|uniref:AT-hook motif nuclear-localized protein 10-like n=1 Tax=Typha angustifolia TaxID=59011 RepID=UPI003C30595E
MESRTGPGTSSAPGKQQKQVHFGTSSMKLVSCSNGVSVFLPKERVPNQEFSKGIAPNAALPVTAPQARQQHRRKRGRPRKYAPNDMALMLLPPNTAVPTISPGNGAPLPLPSVATTAPKKAVRRPTARKHQMKALRSVGIGTMPHVMTVKQGEDITSKITLLSMRTFIPFANQPTVSGGTVTYEGQYEILSLSG